ncbi:MAG: AbrB/MazE/SpoVT family DNA-binding domain-containing protein [Candidatus Heimdallarchaeota archaeon]|nr:AbrB/MazE/SpoVT family DNA-binding domain-containing protein [Candidatus Heimdallarchaeota archaeon]MCK4955401.1 AbrB/MazE/SpoVT family DNA-binding domain-containing protein [Candidatus Heimdallarchaeota archaeon]
MSKEKTEELCCPSGEDGLSCCHVEGVVHVDSKGQIVLPKSLRDDMGIKDKEKLVVVGMRDKGELKSISLFKADKMDDMVKTMLKPTMENIFEK